MSTKAKHFAGSKITNVTQDFKLLVCNKKIIILISQPKHMLWVLKRTVSMRYFFLTPKTYVQTGG